MSVTATERTLYRALCIYFKTLTAYGYRTDYVVYRLLVLDFLTEFIKKFENTLSREDRHLLQDLIFCYSSNICELSLSNRNPACNSSEDIRFFRLEEDEPIST